MYKYNITISLSSLNFGYELYITRFAPNFQEKDSFETYRYETIDSKKLGIVFCP